MDLLARRPCSPVAALLVTLALLAGGACAPAPAPVPQPGLPTGAASAPNFRGPIESVARSEILQYVGRLQFVQDPHLSDEQPLVDSVTPGQLARVGPRARIEPELHSTQITPEQLREGRVIARIISDGPYEPLGIRRGIQYVWVDNSTGRWRAAMIPANGAEPMRMLGALVRDLPHLTMVPSAIWYYARGPGPRPPRPVPQGTCGNRCCMVCPDLGCQDVQDVVDAMLRAVDFGGRPGVPPLRGH
jgi:hypothetical protein